MMHTSTVSAPVQPPQEADPSILERNLAAMWRWSPQTARLLARTSPRADVEFLLTEDGVLTAAAGTGSERRLLASRRRPLEEARRLADTVDLKSAGGIVVMGFGTGHHARILAERLKDAGVVVVFEPDVGLLRAVLERIDHSAWMRQSHVVFVTDAEDTGAISAATRGFEGLLAMGVHMLEHPVSRGRLGEQTKAFAERFTSVLRAVRTTVVTTLVQSEVTIRNLLMNLDYYATCAGIGDLAGVCGGRPAIVVSAGPSLRRNVELLKRPDVRDRFIIIAVQTVLKQLLSHGIRPHYVTALDYHEISKRFYEGLTAEDVEGVTLVAEAKANPAILEAFPGDIRIISDNTLDTLLGDSLARPLGSVKPGTTVAHLAYYLARHMGCDPVVLVGQDLGFTDGQYYAAGAAIHQVWSGELSHFNTLEMMEWQRIARQRGLLHRTRDVLGRPIYTDEQMATYRVQFERDFASDRAEGLRIIDATEGGVEKQHTDVMRLEEVLETIGPAEPLRLPRAQGEADRRQRLSQVAQHTREVRQDVWKLMQNSRRTQSLLEEMLEHQKDQSRVNRLIGEVHRIRKEVERQEPAFTLVTILNQTGTLKRVRADRTIELDASLSPLERQRRQIERDIVNVRWLGDAAERLGELLDDAIGVLSGGARKTGDLIAPADADEALEDTADRPEGEGADATVRASAQKTVAAMIPLDFKMSGLGTARTLEEEFLAGRNPLQMTLERLKQAKGLDSILLLTDDPARAAALVGTQALPVEIVKVDLAPMREHRRAMLGARLWTRACWRGGLGSMSVYDEVCCAALLAPVMAERGIDAAAVVGPDWSLVDPELVDAAVKRYRLRPGGKGAHRITFCHAPPGLGTCVVERTLMQQLADKRTTAGTFATVGGILGYMPVAPAADPIAQPVCVQTAPQVRDAQLRFIPDSEPARALLVRALSPLGTEVLSAQAERIASCTSGLLAGPPDGPPQELLLELCTGRRTSGARSRWSRGLADAIERRIMPLELAERIITEFAQLRSDAALTLAGSGDPLLHPDVFRIVQLARRAGIAGIHLRTDLVCEPQQAEALLDCGVDVISVDLMAESAPTYRTIMGADLFHRVRGNVERLLASRATSSSGMPTPWIVPRLTRCDVAYEEIESFFDRWLLSTGAALIDPLPCRVPGERIEPLPLPRAAAWRLARERMTILSDGRVPDHDDDLSGDRCIGDVSKLGVMQVWRTLCMKRFDRPREAPSLPPDRVRPM